MRRNVRVCTVALLWFSGALADVTVRQSLSMKFPSFVPLEVAKQWQQQIQRGLPQTSVLRIKGGKAYASFGPLETISDYARREVTLLDSSSKQYATVPFAEFGDRFVRALKAGLPAMAAPSGPNSHFDVQTRKTGRVATIQGIQAAESLTEVTMEMPLMTQAPNRPTSGAISTMRLEIRSWVAEAGEIRRLAALAELANYAERNQRAFDTADFVQKALFAVPGVGEQLSGTLRELSGNTRGITLKTETAIYLPAISQLLQLAAGGAPEGFNPNGPMAESVMEVIDISRASLPESDFGAPAGYQPAAFEELVRAAILMPAALPSTAITAR